MKVALSILLSVGFASYAFAQTAPDTAPSQAPATEAPAPEAPKAKPVVDCSKAAAGKVVITDNNTLTEAKAAELAYACFLKSNKAVAAAHKQAVKDSHKDYEDRPQACGDSDELQSLAIKSWNSGRPSMSTDPKGNPVGEMGGEATILVREPILCGGIGTGLFDGIVSSVTTIMEVQFSSTFPMGEEDGPSVDKYTVKLKKIVKL